MQDTINLESFEQHYRVLGLNPSTIEQYKSRVKVFFEWVQKIPQEVELVDIVTFFSHLMEEKKATSTQIVYASALRAYFDYLVQTRQIDHNPMAEFKRRGRTGVRYPKVLDMATIRKMVELPYYHRANETTATFESSCIAFLASTGLRLGEFCKLTRGDIVGNRVRVIGKGGKERYVPIIRKWFSFEIEPIFWKRRTRNKIWYIVKRYGKLVTGEDDITPHTLRHSFATQMVREGVDIVTLKEIMGHTNINTTLVYVHLAGVDIDKALREAGLI